MLYIEMCNGVYIYIYIYVLIYMYVYIYIYIYIYIFINEFYNIESVELLSLYMLLL